MVLATAPSGYTVTAIPVPDGYQTVLGYTINAKSTVVGFASGTDPSTGQPVDRPMLFQKGKFKLLGGDGATGAALDINNRGHIVGFTTPSTPSESHPAMLTTSEATDLGSLGGNMGWAYAINGNDQIVGYSAIDAGGSVHGFLWDEGELSDLGGLAEGGMSIASDINDKGLIVGVATTGTGSGPFDPGARAVLWDGGDIADLGTLGDGDLSVAIVVNSGGQIAGTSNTAPGQTYGSSGMQAFLWEEGEMTALPLPKGSTACLVGDINKQGWVTGSCSVPGADSVFADSIAVIWIDGEIIDLNSLTKGDGQWTVQQAFGMNDAGEIVCHGVGPDGTQQTLILSPTES